MTRLVLDTNVLILFIVGNLVGKSRIRTTRRLESYESNHLTILNNFASQIKSNYSGTLTPTNRKSYSIFINNLPIHKSFQ